MQNITVEGLCVRAELVRCFKRGCRGHWMGEAIDHGNTRVQTDSSAKLLATNWSLARAEDVKRGKGCANMRGVCCDCWKEAAGGKKGCL